VDNRAIDAVLFAASVALRQLGKLDVRLGGLRVSPAGEDITRWECTETTAWACLQAPACGIWLRGGLSPELARMPHLDSPLVFPAISSDHGPLVDLMMTIVRQTQQMMRMVGYKDFQVIPGEHSAEEKRKSDRGSSLVADFWIQECPAFQLEILILAR
jgi:hypothetical protein